MSVKTTDFGAVRLSGQDAKKFVNQVVYGKPRKEAVASYKRGERLVAEFREKGYATIARSNNEW